MNTTGTITMSMCELDRLRVIQAVAERQLKPGLAAARLGLTVRQIERPANRYRADGAVGLISKRRSRPNGAGRKFKWPGGGQGRKPCGIIGLIRAYGFRTRTAR